MCEQRGGGVSKSGRKQVRTKGPRCEQRGRGANKSGPCVLRGAVCAPTHMCVLQRTYFPPTSKPPTLRSSAHNGGGGLANSGNKSSASLNIAFCSSTHVHRLT